MVLSTIKKILKLLIDQQTSQNNSTKSQPKAFKAGQRLKNNLTIGKAYHKNPQIKISNHASIVLVINILKINASI